MTWNHRVLAFENKKEIRFQIHEVYYDKEGAPNGYTEKPITVNGTNLNELEWVLEQMKICIGQPILWGGDRFPEEYK